MIIPRLILGVAAITMAVAPSFAQTACEKLMTRHFAGITITSASEIPSGPFTLPGAANAATVEMPAFCRVAAVVGAGGPIRALDARAVEH